MQRKTKRVSTQDTVPNVQPHKREQLTGCLVELVVRTGIATSIEPKVGRKYAPAGNRRNVGHL